MSRCVLTRDQVRQLDQRAIRDYGVPSLVLMENAGRGCAELLMRLGVRGTVLLCCGKGNNGGDGFVVARHLDAMGCKVRVWIWDDPKTFSQDAAVNFQILQSASVAVERPPAESPDVWSAAAGDIDWCVDALLGTGVQGPPREPYASVIRWMNELPARRLAIDLPSGLDCDTGQPHHPTVRADVTVTFVAWKAGFLQPQAQAYLGRVYVMAIGAPRRVLEEFGVPAAPTLPG